jgi:hypothetical protein
MTRRKQWCSDVLLWPRFWWGVQGIACWLPAVLQSPAAALHARMLTLMLSALLTLLMRF